jgi:hypothetical protein
MAFPLKKGGNGHDVRDLQQLLTERGYPHCYQRG